MLGSFLKRRLNENQIANIFVNGLLDVIDKSFKDVASLINVDPAFELTPGIDEDDSGEFIMIVFVGNIVVLQSTFETEHYENIKKLIVAKVAPLFGVSDTDFDGLVKDYISFISRVNKPSKNVLYGMSKSLFYKYNLNEFQTDYYKKIQAPNPLFLKRMDDIMQNFIWDWTAFFKKYKL